MTPIASHLAAAVRSTGCCADISFVRRHSRSQERIVQCPDNPSSRGQRAKSVCLLGVMALTISCDRVDVSTVAPVSQAAIPNISSLVVGPAAAAMRANGQLELGTPNPLTPAKSEISEFSARQLAQAFITTHGGGFRRVLEADHGGPIDFAALHPCGRVWYANAAFAPLASEVPQAWHRVYGPWWLVTFCGAAERPEVSVAVSAYATDLAIKNERLAYPPIHGGEFQILGIPLSLAFGLPASPERAVELAATISGVRVEGVPELIAPPPGEFPQSARWRLRLERPVSIAVHGLDNAVHRIDAVTEVFVATTYFSKPDRVQVADLDQPASLPLSYHEDPAIGSTRAQAEATPVRSTTLVRRAQFPIRYLTAEGY